MKIKLYWPKCDLSYDNFHFMIIDSFWVECTPKEAEKKIFPYLNQNQIAESKSYYEPKNEKINKYDFETDLLCFLVSRDLKTIVPFPWETAEKLLHSKNNEF